MVSYYTLGLWNWCGNPNGDLVKEELLKMSNYKTEKAILFVGIVLIGLFCFLSGCFLASLRGCTNAHAQVCPIPEIYKPFIRGDVNSDGKVDLSDVIYLLNFLYQSGPCPKCLTAAFINNDGNIDLSDAVYLQQYLFNGGPPPGAPFPICGRPNFYIFPCEVGCP